MSSAAGDDDQYVEDFHQDLCRRVAELASERETVDGFLGTIGSETPNWPAGMATALSRCDVFIAVLSPRYFLNRNCGKQYWVFNQRLRQFEAETGVHVPALLPVMWSPTHSMIDIPMTEVTPDDETAHRGLRRYVRITRLRDDYERFIERLAQQIISVTREHRLPQDTPVPDLTQTPSAFTVADLRVDPAAATPATTGSQHVHFIIAAGSRSDMDEIRQDLSYYGETAADWAPYLPALDRPLASHAQALAADRLVGSDVAEIGDLIERIEQASRNNEIVVLLVDPWSTRLDAYRKVLAEADRRGLGGTAVLAPANQTDLETERNLDELGFDLRQTLRNSAKRPGTLFRTRIGTVDNFDTDLANVLEEARNRVFTEGRVHNLPLGQSSSERPILRGP